MRRGARRDEGAGARRIGRVAGAWLLGMGLAIGAATGDAHAQQPAPPPATAPPDAGTGPPAASQGAASGQSLDARLRADRAELDRIRAERTELEQRMAELRSSVHDLADEVANLDRQANATARAVRALDEQLVVINAQVQVATGKLVTAQDELVIKRAMLRHRLIDIYERGPLYSTEALLTAGSFGELVARYKYLHLLALRDQALVARVEVLGKQVARERRVLVSLQSSLAENRAEKADEEDRLRTLESQRERSLGQAERTQAATAARLRQIDLAESRLGSVINALEDARRRAAARPNAPAPSASTLTTRDLGRLDWPVDGTILYRFGRVINSNNTTTRWNGIGIGAPLGTSVHAVESGTVVVAEPIGTYGLTIIIQHGGGDYSVYGSLSKASVKKGATVDRGDVIGSVGRTDPDLPAHLHFEIRRDQGRAVDPLEWLRGGSAR
jgi:septal ring factor EnvC (AmiA/AmiB activator)